MAVTMVCTQPAVKQSVHIIKPFGQASKTDLYHKSKAVMPFGDPRYCYGFLKQKNIKPTFPKAHKGLDVTTTKYNGSVKFLDMFLDGGILQGKGKQFYDAQKKYGINAIFMIAVAKVESNCGKSKLAKTKHNIAGMRGKKRYLRFKNTDSAIDAMASNLKRLYKDHGLTTIGQIDDKYAKSSRWGSAVINEMNKMKSVSNSCVLKFN